MWSPLPEARVLPSGLKATEETAVVVALEEGAGIGPAQGPAERFIGSCRDLWAADPGVAAFGLFGLMAVSARSEVARAWFGRS